MKNDIHPDYSEIKATCGCGNTFSVMSTLKDDLFHYEVIYDVYDSYQDRRVILNLIFDLQLHMSYQK